MRLEPYTDAERIFTSDIATAADTDVVVTIAADSDHAWVIERIDLSYDDTPTGGKLTISDGISDTWEVDFTSGGAGVFNGSGQAPYIGVKGSAVTITLAAGGTGVAGKLNVFYR